MFLRSPGVLCLLSLLPLVTRAQTVQSILWNIPDGRQADLAQTFIARTTVALSWNAWPSTSYIDPIKNLVDLWVTAYDTNNNSFNQSLISNLNLTAPGVAAWTIAIPDDTLISDAKYVLRFKDSGPKYDPDSDELSSPSFLVLRGAAASASLTSTTASTTSSSSSSTSSVTTSVSSAPSVAPVTASVSPVSSPIAAVSTGLTAGAKAGIGVGVSLGVLALAALGYWALRRRKNEATARTSRTFQESDQPNPHDSQYKDIPGQPKYNYVQPHELQGTPGDGVEVAELSSIP